ncbi:MAG: helix-turn-helix transcriptional regulator [Lentisphaerae bacterium]|nr:helix-turn-helix transcriptional regulator [Lentisphaerota bacterium]
MEKHSDFQTFFKNAGESPAYWVERAVLEFTEALVTRMASAGVSRAELARRIGCSPAYVTKILGGRTNFTLESMVRIASAVGCGLRIGLDAQRKRKRGGRRARIMNVGSED